MNSTLRMTCLLTLCALLCPRTFAQPTKITGRVIDYYKKPIADVSVKIKNTDFHTRTNTEGYFELDYASGNRIEVMLVGRNTEFLVKSLSIAQKVHYPLGSIPMHRTPGKALVGIVGKEEYLAVAHHQIETRDKEAFVHFPIGVSVEEIPVIARFSTCIASRWEHYGVGAPEKTNGCFVKIQSNFKIPAQPWVNQSFQVLEEGCVSTTTKYRGINYFLYSIADDRVQSGDLIGYLPVDHVGRLMGAIFLFRIE